MLSVYTITHLHIHVCHWTIFSIISKSYHDTGEEKINFYIIQNSNHYYNMIQPITKTVHFALFYTVIMKFFEIGLFLWKIFFSYLLSSFQNIFIIPICTSRFNLMVMISPLWGVMRMTHSYRSSNTKYSLIFQLFNSSLKRMCALLNIFLLFIGNAFKSNSKFMHIFGQKHYFCFI